MKNFIRNWDYKKHIAAEAMLYASMALVGNAFFAKGPGNGKKSSCLIEAYKAMPKKQKCFNHILLGCFAVDMTASYFLLKGLKKIAG
jgi:hypothetical protein